MIPTRGNMSRLFIARGEAACSVAITKFHKWDVNEKSIFSSEALEVSQRAPCSLRKLRIVSSSLLPTFWWVSSNPRYSGCRSITLVSAFFSSSPLLCICASVCSHGLVQTPDLGLEPVLMQDYYILTNHTHKTPISKQDPSRPAFEGDHHTVQSNTVLVNFMSTWCKWGLSEKRDLNGGNIPLRPIWY